MQMIFLPDALLPGAVIWKAFASYARPANEKPSGVKDTGNKN